MEKDLTERKSEIVKMRKRMGGEIKRLREERNMSRREAATLLNMSVPALYYIETGHHGLSIERYADFQRVFGISPGDLLEAAYANN